MLCEKCNKRNATIHMTEIVKNCNREVHLCEECARIVGLNTKTSGFSLTVPEMLTFLNINDVSGEEENMVCHRCSLKYTEFKQSGKMGCPDCYRYFTELNPVLEKNFSKEIYSGKIPENYRDDFVENITVKPKPIVSVSSDQTSDLKDMLDLAVLEERYEDAVSYRDSLKNLENK